MALLEKSENGGEISADEIVMTTLNGAISTAQLIAGFIPAPGVGAAVVVATSIFSSFLGDGQPEGPTMEEYVDDKIHELYEKVMGEMKNAIDVSEVQTHAKVLLLELSAIREEMEWAFDDCIPPGAPAPTPGPPPCEPEQFLFTFRVVADLGKVVHKIMNWENPQHDVLSKATESQVKQWRRSMLPSLMAASTAYLEVLRGLEVLKPSWKAKVNARHRAFVTEVTPFLHRCLEDYEEFRRGGVYESGWDAILTTGGTRDDNAQARQCKPGGNAKKSARLCNVKTRVQSHEDPACFDPVGRNLCKESQCSIRNDPYEVKYCKKNPAPACTTWERDQTNKKSYCGKEVLDDFIAQVQQEVQTTRDRVVEGFPAITAAPTPAPTTAPKPPGTRSRSLWQQFAIDMNLRTTDNAWQFDLEVKRTSVYTVLRQLFGWDHVQPLTTLDSLAYGYCYHGEGITVWGEPWTEWGIACRKYDNGGFYNPMKFLYLDLPEYDQEGGSVWYTSPWR